MIGAEEFPIGLSTVVLGLAYVNLIFSIQEVLNKSRQPLWKKLWQWTVQRETEDLCRILLLAWALFPISTLQNLRMLWLIILTELLYRRLKKQFSLIQGNAEDVCRMLLMLVALSSSVSSLQDIWLLWFLVLVEFIYRKMKLKVPPIKEFTHHICSLLPGRKHLPEGTLKTNLLAELKCPTCTRLMKSPITMCQNGHNVCNRCKPRLNKCPICRGELLDLRNISLEKVAESIQAKTKKN